ncbi:MAG: nucleotide exchange factor GrpE [Spirochaetaceae bacterium]|jgi:molecular chaperone GrpE (heat shock protein)|nr:nucleotide exchange factor GrpE [Spirochaetaceae bacterium]
MINFEAELNQLLSREIERFPQYELVELAAAGQELLTELNKRQTDVSLQIEEIYDLAKEQEGLRKRTDAETARADQLVMAAIGLVDLLEDFCTYAGQSGSEELEHQAGILWKNAGSILASRGIFRFGEKGQPLDPQIHTVKASAESPFPPEQVVQVLQSGYVYRNTLVRKAAVVVSRGRQDGTGETEAVNIETGDYVQEEIEDNIEEYHQTEGEFNE